MLTFLVVVYVKMYGNIQKGCTVIVVYKDMPSDSPGGKYRFVYEYTCL